MAGHDAAVPARSCARPSARLAAAGVASPEHDAAELLAHVLGSTRSRLALVDSVEPPPARPSSHWSSGGRPGNRCSTSPGPRRSATSSSRWARGSSCPVPRPSCSPGGRSTGPARPSEAPVVVDLCTGSGAIALSVATEEPTAVVHAVELDPDAHAWAVRNTSGERRGPPAGRHGGRLPRARRHRRRGGLQPAVHPARGLRDASLRRLATTTPPWRSGPARTASTPSGVLETTAARLLRPGGWVGSEHADLQGEAAVERVRARRDAGRRCATTRIWQVVRAS